MPAKTERRHKQGQESRQRILEAALEIAAERGYDGTTVALITERTGLPASSVYWQFKNKDELLAEALDFSYRTWRRDGPTWQPANYAGSLHDRVRTRIRNSAESIVRQPEYWRLGLMVTLLHKTSKIAAQDRFIQVRGETRLIIDEWWQSALPSKGAANKELTGLLTDGYLAFIDGLFVAHRAESTVDLMRITDVIGPAIADVGESWSAHPSTSMRRFAKSGARRRSGRAALPPVGDDSRSRVLAAAAEIAAERGYRGTTISRVCKRAGLPVSSVYWFFTDKDELLAEVVRHSWDEWLANQPTWGAPEGRDAWGDVLGGILLQSVQSLVEAPTFMRIGHMLTLEQQDTEVAARTAFLGIRAGIEDQITSWFASNLPKTKDTPKDLPRILAQALIAFTDGFFLSSQIDRPDTSVPAFVALVVGVLEGAARQPSHRA